jgi:hypothetical protein
MRHARVASGVAGVILGVIGVAPSGAAQSDPWYGVGEQVEGHPYAYWNAAWARFEWEPGGSASPLLHPQGCNHVVVGRVVFLPGPLKGQRIACAIPAGDSVFVPTASVIALKATKQDTRASMRRVAGTAFTQTKVLDVTIDGKRIDARRFKNTTGFFLLRAKKGSPIGLTGSRTAIQSGYNFVLRPPSPGTHTVALHVRIADGGKTLYEARTTFALEVAA